MYKENLYFWKYINFKDLLYALRNSFYIYFKEK